MSPKAWSTSRGSVKSWRGWSGQDATGSRELLQRFEEMQAMHVADRDRILRELAPSAPFAEA
jgi:hypothetical protein